MNKQVISYVFMLSCYVHALLLDQSKYLRAYYWWDMGVFVSSSHTLESRYSGGHGNYVLLHHTNVFIVEDNILWPLGGPSDQTVSQKTLSKSAKMILYNLSQTLKWQ